jgi:hypothetical protein
MEATTMSGNQWAEIIARNKVVLEDEVPEGFYPRDEWEKIWNVATAETLKRLRKLIDTGVAETKKFRVFRSNGQPYPTPHYKLIK